MKINETLNIELGLKYVGEKEQYIYVQLLFMRVTHAKIVTSYNIAEDKDLFSL